MPVRDADRLLSRVPGVPWTFYTLFILVWPVSPGFRSAWVCLLWSTGVTGCRHVGMNHSLKEKMIKIYIDLHKWSQLGLIYGGVSNGRAGVLLYFPCPVANNEDFALGQISNKGKNIVHNKRRSAEIADFSLFFYKSDTPNASLNIVVSHWHSDALQVQ